MRRYADGDTTAFNERIKRDEPRAYGFVFEPTRPEDHAQDVYQGLFLRLHRSRASYDPDRPFAPWFFQITAGLLVDDHRLAFRNREVSTGEQDRASEDLGNSVSAVKERASRAMQHLGVCAPLEGAAAKGGPAGLGVGICPS
jgi:DNA-directed RNA polymerase specialized sigma24 family protein